MTLEIRDLSVAFRRPDGSRLRALEDLSLSLARGELLGLVGGSGAGKSLVAEAVMGALPRNAEISGEIRAQGRLALAPQGIEALDPLARIGAQIRRFARLAGRRADPAALCAALDLPQEALEAYPHELSGGMAKRALLATALAAEPDHLLADEPTLGLDPETADRVMALLGRLAAEGRGVLVVSHDLPRLVSVAGRILVLREGRPVETAPAAAFREGGLRHPFSRELWAAQSWSEPC